jgi:hypothetical protein
VRRTSPKAYLSGGVLLAAAVLLANLAAFTAWTAPRWRASWGVAGADRLEVARQRIEPRLQQARATYGLVVAAEDDLRELRARLTSAAASSEVIGMLTGAAGRAGIEIEDATSQFDVIEELGVVQAAFYIPVAGSYPAIRGLLGELDELPVFLVIDGVGLRAGGAAGPPGSRGDVRLELAVSVFLPDPGAGTELPAVTAPPAVSRGAASIAARAAERLREARRGDDPEELAAAIVARLVALPPIPVTPEALVVHLEKLEYQPPDSTPRRNLFAIVEPYRPPVETAPQDLVELEPLEPLLPVQLRGVVIIEGRLHASLSDGVALFVVKAGDRLPNGVEILEVGADYVEVLFRDERTRLSLEGSQP